MLKDLSTLFYSTQIILKSAIKLLLPGRMAGLGRNQATKWFLETDYPPPECLNLRILRMELSCGERKKEQRRRESEGEIKNEEKKRWKS